MRRVGLKNYLTDRRFTAEKCSFEIYGYPPNYGSAVISNQQGTTCPTYCGQASYANQYPCNTAQCQSSGGGALAQCAQCTNPAYANQYPCNTATCLNSGSGGSSSTQCPAYCSQASYANQYPCNTATCQTSSGTNCPSYCLQPAYANDQACLSCNGGSTSQCPTQYMSYCSNPANANQSPCNTYPCNMLNGMNTGSQSSTYDLGFCGSTTDACDFTVFVPNSSAIDYFSVSNNGYRVMRDTPRFQWVSGHT